MGGVWSLLVPAPTGPDHRDVSPGCEQTLYLCHLSGIVQSDPLIPVDRTLIPSPPPRPKNPVFDDEEKSKVKCIRPAVLREVWHRSCCRELQFPSWSATFAFTFDTLLTQLLAKLLKSKNPDDLQEANKLIKSMVKEVSGPWAWVSGVGAHDTEQKSFPLASSLLFVPATSPTLEAVDGIEEQ